MAIADHVFDVEIPERISKDVMEQFQAQKASNKPKKGKGGKGKKKKKWKSIPQITKLNNFSLYNIRLSDAIYNCHLYIINFQIIYQYWIH